MMHFGLPTTHRLPTFLNRHRFVRANLLWSLAFHAGIIGIGLYLGESTPKPTPPSPLSFEVIQPPANPVKTANRLLNHAKAQDPSSQKKETVRDQVRQIPTPPHHASENSPSNSVHPYWGALHENLRTQLSPWVEHQWVNPDERPEALHLRLTLRPNGELLQINLPSLQKWLTDGKLRSVPPLPEDLLRGDLGRRESFMVSVTIRFSQRTKHPVL